MSETPDPNGETFTADRPDPSMVRGESSDFECPGHGPMTRVFIRDVLVRVMCGRCGRQPIDFLERVVTSGGSRPAPDAGFRQEGRGEA